MRAALPGGVAQGSRRESAGACWRRPRPAAERVVDRDSVPEPGLFGAGHLVRQQHLAALAGRLHDGEQTSSVASPQRPSWKTGRSWRPPGTSPRARRRGRGRALGTGISRLPLVAVDEQPIRRLPHVAALATDERDAEERLVPPVGAVRRAPRRVARPRSASASFSAPRPRGAPRRARRAGRFVSGSRGCRPRPPTSELRRVEMAVAVVHERRRRAVLELQVGRVGALGSARGSQMPVMARTLRTSPPPISRTMSTWCGPWMKTTSPPSAGSSSCGMRGRYMNSLKFQVWIMPSGPSSPLRTICAHSRTGGSKLWVWPHSSLMPFARRRRSCLALVEVSAIGFSTMTCLPCSAAR